MDPGIFEDIPAHEYRKWPAVSNSQLGVLARSPAHLKRGLPAESKELDFGQTFHVYMLEPKKFLDRYAECPKVDRRTTAGRKEYDDFMRMCAVNGCEPVSEDDLETIRQMWLSIHNHPEAAKLLKLPRRNEVSALWPDTDTGLYCRSRMDALLDKHGIIIDLKTTRDASRRAFEKSVFIYGYARQAAFYIDGCKANGIDIDSFVIIACEKEPPYAVACYLLKEDAVEYGRREYKRLLKLYAECVEKDHWPSYGDDVVEIGIPEWVYKQEVESLPY